MDFIFAGPGPAFSMLMPAGESFVEVVMLIDGFMDKSSWPCASRHWRKVQIAAAPDMTSAATAMVELFIATAH